MRTAELTGPALDWAVAQCAGIELIGGKYNRLLVDGRMSRGQEMMVLYKPSTDWGQGGPIIEREEIELRKWALDGWEAHATNYSFLNTPNEKPEFARQHGFTPLIAAMRCFVASRLGDEVDVPEGLK